jgi:hypothetical protein
MVRERLVKVLRSGLALALTFGIAQAAERAEAPIRKVGDQWVYRDIPGDHIWTRTVLTIGPNGDYTAKRGDDVVLKFDAAGNELDQRGPEYNEQWFKFPMEVGNKWSHSRTARWVPGLHGPQEVIESATWEVQSFEKVSVPAGTFECFRVVGKIYYLNAANTSYADRTYWYCPSIRGMAKKQGRGGTWLKESASELTSFTGGKE